MWFNYRPNITLQCDQTRNKMLHSNVCQPMTEWYRLMWTTLCGTLYDTTNISGSVVCGSVKIESMKLLRNRCILQARWNANHQKIKMNVLKIFYYIWVYPKHEIQKRFNSLVAKENVSQSLKNLLTIHHWCFLTNLQAVSIHRSVKLTVYSQLVCHMTSFKSHFSCGKKQKLMSVGIHVPLERPIT